MGKRKQDNAKGGELFSVPKNVMGYVRTGTRATNGLEQTSPAKVLARNAVHRLMSVVLRRAPIVLLDKAIEHKIGKPSSKSVQARKEARTYNVGFHAGVERGKVLKAKEIKQQLKETN